MSEDRLEWTELVKIADLSPTQARIIKVLEEQGSLLRPGPRDGYFTPNAGSFYSGLSTAMVTLVRSGVVKEVTGSTGVRVYTLAKQEPL